MPPDSPKVFISYNRADHAWAEWIAWTLEESSYSVTFQDWDIRPGQNFVLAMQEASETARHTLLVLSPSSLASRFVKAEWSAAFAEDPAGEQRRLIPVRVEECEPRGILGPIVYADLVGLGEEEAARVLVEAFAERAKPDEAPVFPGALSFSIASERPAFPGAATKAV